MVAVCLLLVACGPAEDNTDQADLTIATQQIAQDYAASGDLARAQSSLAALDVANPNQWLLYVAETAAKDAAAQPELVNALTKLAESSGLRSPILSQYAIDHGFVSLAAAPVQSQAIEAATLKQPSQGVDNSGAIAAPVDAAPIATDTPVVEPTATTEPIPTPAQKAQVIASTLVNLRAGPGTDYDLAGGLQVGESAEIVAKNQDATWWEVQLGNGAKGWVLGELVQTSGALDSIAAAANVLPTPTAAPVAIAQVTTVEVAQPAPQAEPTATAAPQQNSSEPYFRVVHRRMWSVDENGTCRGQHLLRIKVVDANNSPLNGVTLKGIYTGAIYRTGDQGKGDGIMEFDLYGDGEGFIVTNDANGAAVGSDRAEGFTTNSRDIDKQTLIQAGYCSDDSTCQTFYDQWGCKGHHSWEATFQRNY